MSFHAENFQEHYKSVRARLWPTKAPVVDRPISIVRKRSARRYSDPIGPTRPERPGAHLHRRLYRWPIGPKWGLPKTRTQEARRIVLEVAEKHGLHPARMLSHTRRKEIVAARHEAWLAVHDAYPGWSIAACARFFGINHTSLLHVLAKRRYKSAPVSPDAAKKFVEGLGE
jgi:hypothetical protein